MPDGHNVTAIMPNPTEAVIETPPWADGPMPDANAYLESECFVAGALSTMEPFRNMHPAWCLPFARQALDALSEWEPSDG